MRHPATQTTPDHLTPDAPAWHALPHDAVCAALDSPADGLDARTAAERWQQYGPNQLGVQVRTHPLRRFFAQFHNALIYLLLCAALLSLLMKHWVDGAVILAVVLINAIVGVVQEGRAEQALDAIRQMIAPHATVMRGGERVVVDASELVPGDRVLVEAGDKVPADLRVLRARALSVDEAILTGESVPATKREAAVAQDAPLGDRHSMLYSGTVITTGQATGVVVATAAATELGRISGLVGTVETLTTPLLRQINQFSRRFTVFAIVSAVLLFLYAVLVQGHDWVEAQIMVVALAVGVVPEGLPAVITITLAIGVARMAARHAVVRRLPAVETLGATSVICSDKTGTLTRNEMTARRVATALSVAELTGSGYAPHGELVATDGGPASADEVRDLLVRTALLCNDAHVVEQDGAWSVLGDPMEGALVTLAAKTGMDTAAERAAWRRVDDIPFDAQHRYMATLHETPSGDRCVLLKGAPERVLALCAVQATSSQHTVALDPAAWQAQIDAAAQQGERVLAFAMKPALPAAGPLCMDDVGDGLVFLGIVGFIDPPRQEAIAAVAECRAAGIAVKMITGDHRGTAQAIAAQLAIADRLQVMDGAALDAMPDDALREAVEHVNVFARAAPEHKLRIVRALQANGHVVAMTGDGVNDAPAVKQADVGVAMGRKGTEAAKEAAQMVLMDDNFASIVAAVREGRTVYDNIRKVIGWTLPTNGGEFLAVVVAILFGLTMPLTPVQILWINMILTVTLGLALAFEPPEPGVMQRPPRPVQAPVLSRFLVWRIAFVSLLFMGGVFGIFHYALAQGHDLETARTMVVNTLVVMEIFYLFNVRYLHTSSFSLRGALGTPAVLAAVGIVVVAQAAFTYLPVMQGLFGTAPVALPDLLVIVGIGVLLMLTLEAEKALVRRLWPATAYTD